MAVPSYVTLKNVRGNDTPENVVLLQSTSNSFLYLIWDDLDQYARAKFDEVYTTTNLVSVLKNTNYRNQTFYQYLSYAFVRVQIGDNNTVLNSVMSSVERQVYDPSFNHLRVGKYSGNTELATYETTNVFSYLSVYGTSRLRDVVSVTGTGSVSNVEGKIRLSTGTTAASSVKVETVERGRYISGKSSEAGVAVWLMQPLTGDQTVSIELGDDSNGARFVIEANDNRIETVRNGIVESTVSQPNWNINPADGTIADYTEQSLDFNPAENGYIYTFLFNWYGLGKIIYSLQTTLKESKEPVTNIPVHEFVPEEFNGQSFVDPNLPIRVIVDNGTTENDVLVDIGGRRYDVLGDFKPEFRKTTEMEPISTLSSRRVVLGLRRKAEFPVAGRINTVPVYVSELESLISGGDAKLRVYSVPRGTLTGTWGNLDEVDTSETSLELNTTINDITALNNTTKHLLIGPKIIGAGTRGSFVLSEEKGLRVPMIRDEELVVEIDPDASIDGNVVITALEEF